MNFFKNAIVYRMTRDIQISVESLENQLAALAFTPCASQDMMRVGWVSPMSSHGEALTHAAGNQILICMQREEKILPSSVIKKELWAKIEKLEGEQHRKLKKTEKDSLKDEVIHTLLPRAFSKESQTYLWIDNDNQRIFVDANSAKRAEDTLALLRKTLGSLPVTPMLFASPIELTLTDWVSKNELPTEFMLQDEAELKAILEEGGVIRCKHQDLITDEIATHIESGKYVTKLALEWEERIQFTLSDDFTIKKIKFSEALREKNDDIDREDFAQRFDADFVLFSGELSRMFDSLINALGGEIK
ncbi:recombination-associated protein RdgC [Xenorhabdus hominickii]|uniref:Recombination-associated protein RdgC n=1 Tax=Xenorhabdus hominickii TaxID=351679 RepID=A0A2G0Q257_XENHO|nr:recombination-associated protein RdgC [Xenorhabdus hominickii]AOM40202.1 recombination-associated protein RdgC [Xenorhabdus hominickii]PHM53297.1 recombination associated protein [Xenorhabdus hominickii]